MRKFQTSHSTPIGTVYLLATENGLERLGFSPADFPVAAELEQFPESIKKILAQTKTQLEEYFSGLRKEFTVPLSSGGTPFQRLVWQQLQAIPYGKTCSYLELAAAIRRDKAVRAVGSANGKNPWPIIVPCHRVIAHDGSLGGYSGGLAIKTALLSHEQAHPPALQQ